MKKLLIYIGFLLQQYLNTGCNDSFNEIGKSKHKSYVINFEFDSVYVKSSLWGLTGDHMQIVFSSQPFNLAQFDSASTFTFFEPVVYYKKVKDTLELYPTMKAQIPLSFSSKIVVKQNVINKLHEINDYKLNYSQYGLTKISVYDK